ncbi:MAG: tripartite tricarboxylate transporter TctB family protein, partial [Planctomycetaceae bacterium]|nr:tripartite tricarboxylate transporter TctB family protein [Planctomycetaceae bacterium]
KEIGKPVVVVNRTGGAGAIGHFAGAKAKPDGQTITMATFELSTMHRMRISRLTFEDFDCLVQVSADPAALFVQQHAPWKSLSQFIETARTSPGRLKMSGTATGGAWDLARIGLQRAADLPVDAVIWVPHQGSAPSLIELIGGHLDAVCCSLAEAAPQVASGNLRALAVMSDDRIADFPDVPTAKEQGIDWTAVAWRGLAIPDGTPPEFVAPLQATCLKIATSNEFRSFMKKNGFVVNVRAGEEFRSYLRQQDEQWREVVHFAGYEKGLTGNHDPGPLALPGMLCIGLIISGSIEWVRRRRPIDAIASNPVDPGFHTRNFTYMLVALIAYVVAIPVFGFGASTLCFVTLLVRRFGASWRAAAAGAIVIAFIVWILFVVSFRVQLPTGRFGLPF